ncbi:hypothetical protein CRG98_040701 [Punica granatum]|uniref:RNase H type-1 domain-containing protein n=1 Tax=Punica granatum TaxID=22663 RepID=A0A2I0I4J3_PUNGR|nr:hypothetical protein CRG98_040701 [Punica granatum]
MTHVVDWSIGSRESTRFRHDRWVPLHGPLIDLATGEHFFFIDNKEQWLLRNLSCSRQGSGDISWALIFGVNCWLFWKWRNKALFDPHFSRPHECTGIIFKTASGFAFARAASDDLSIHNIAVKEWRNVGWRKPFPEWYKLNMDEASKGNPGNASVGGLAQDEHGRWLGGFVRNIGITTSITVELWVVKPSLELAWESGVRKVILEVNSEVVHSLLCPNRTQMSEHEALV